MIMTKINKTINQLKAFKEYYSNAFFEVKWFQDWAEAEKCSGAFDTIRFLLAHGEGEEDVKRVLRKHEIFLNVVLSNFHKPKIDNWYRLHPADEALRFERNEQAKVHRLYKISSKYKTYLFDVINEKTGSVITTMGLLSLPKIAVNDEINSSISSPIKSLDPSKFDKRIISAATKYKVTNKLQATLSEHGDHWAKQVLKAILNFLTVGIPAKISSNAFCFWKTRRDIAAESINNALKSSQRIVISG